jgi:hypothetical protein
MKSDVCKLTTDATDLRMVLKETAKSAAYRDLDPKETSRLRLLAEELVEMLPSLLRFSKGSYWVESTGKKFELHVELVPNETLSERKREQLLDVSTSKQNAAAVGIMAKIRIAAEFFLVDYEETSTMSETFYVPGTPSVINLADPTWSLNSYREEAKKAQGEVWDELEKSIVANLADDVVVALEGRQVDIVVKKEFK